MLELDAELERVSWACRECVLRFPTTDQSIYYEWVWPIFRPEFGDELWLRLLRGAAAQCRLTVSVPDAVTTRHVSPKGRLFPVT